MSVEVIHLSDLVADLKQRVEALERELAAMKLPAKQDPPYDVYLTEGKKAELAGKWDTGIYSEDDFVA